MDKVEDQSLVQTYGKKSLPIVLLLFCALALLVTGIFRPFTQVTKLWIFENQVSVYDGLITLMKAQEYFLFTILLVFTVIFPFVKILSLLTLWLKGGLSRKRIVQLYNFVAHLGKWSMLDVFVVANLVLLLKSGSVASIQIRDGFFLFFASVMLTQAASVWIGVIARKNLEAG
ncbi:MAG: pqiA [Pedosphaera sp.]|nr:pqiA [Pedosphaera sp.]